MTQSLRRAMLDSRVPQNVKAHVRATKEVQEREQAREQALKEQAQREQEQKHKKEQVNGKRKKPDFYIRAPQYGYR